VRRRAFISLLGGVAAAWPLAARGQQAGKLPTIGFLGASTPSAWSQWTAAFVQRLRELGWIEGRTVAIEYRWAEGRSEHYAEIAAEFVSTVQQPQAASALIRFLASPEAAPAISKAGLKPLSEP
jgi:putative tryptophan/tyrosine transport system substrate-binding protein